MLMHVSNTRLPAARRVDRLAWALQVLLLVGGICVQLAVGAHIRWHGEVLVQLRYPFLGLVLILVGLGLRWLLSPRFRAWTRLAHWEARRRVLEYANGSPKVPWLAGLFWVFLPTLVLYQSNHRTISSADTVPAVLTAVSIVTEGNWALDEHVESDRAAYTFFQEGDHYYSQFGWGVAVAALPFVQACEWLGGDLSDRTMLRRLEKVMASTIASLAAMLMFFVFLRVAPPAVAAFLTIFFTLGTQNWTIAGQAMWQHTPLMLCVVMLLFVEYHRNHAPGWIGSILQGALLGIGTAVRPTAALLVAPFGLYVLLTRGRKTIAYAAGVFLGYLPFFVIYVSVFGSVLGPYKPAPDPQYWQSDYLVAILGNLVSPVRGVLVYEPFVALAVFGFFGRARTRSDASLRLALAAWFLLHLLLVSRFTHWWGGHCWGPRYFTEVMPAFCVMVAPAVVRLWQARIARGILYALLAWSIALHAIGAFAPSATDWCETPIDVDAAPRRLWDWTDPPFLRPFRSAPSPKTSTRVHQATIPREGLAAFTCCEPRRRHAACSRHRTAVRRHPPATPQARGVRPPNPWPR